jgi:hypothetical protein
VAFVLYRSDEGHGKWPWPNLKHCYCSVRLFVNLCQEALIVGTTLTVKMF